MKIFTKKDWFLWVVALVLAVSTYFYIQDVQKERESIPIDPSYKLIKLTAKSVPVKIRFASNPPIGYRLIEEKVVVDPRRIVVIGPEALLEEAAFAETAILDISHSKRKVFKDVPLESVAGIRLGGESYTVDVVVPIEKIDVNR